MPKKRSALAPALLVCCWALPAAGQNAVAQFYHGKTIAVIVGSSPRGGSDTYARLMARHFSKHVPGHPEVVVSNMAGAAGNMMSAYVANVAKKDGTVIGATSASAILNPLIGQNPVTTYDPSKLNFLGSANSDVYLCLARTDAPVKTFADVFKHQLVLGGTASGDSSVDFPTLEDNVLGTKFKIVTGYAGSSEVSSAIEKGEVQGECGMGWSRLRSTHPEWIREHKINILAQEDIDGYPKLNKAGVPRTVEFATTAEQRQILALVYSQEIFGRPYMVAREVPKERVAALRKAFMATWTDPALLAEAKKIHLDVKPRSGAAIQAVVAKVYATPKPIIAKAKKALVAPKL